MTHHTKTARDTLPDSAFGLPETRAYPMPDAAHERNAKARAAEEFRSGNLTAKDRACVDDKANRILGQALPHQALRDPE